MIRRPTGSLYTIGKVTFAGLLLLVLSSCDVLRESDTDTGIGGKGVMAGELQPHIGRGSPSDWKSATCADELYSMEIPEIHVPDAKKTMGTIVPRGIWARWAQK